MQKIRVKPGAVVEVQLGPPPKKGETRQGIAIQIGGGIFPAKNNSAEGKTEEKAEKNAA
ncbi:MAG TPA: hypothetical protein VJB65_00460 [Patescibacteria group bacterium]|nr:hypothetical protein [Patescibacteria group bacterium]